MAPRRFSFRRALRLLSIALEVAIAVGLAAKIVLVVFWLDPRFQLLRPGVDVSINFVLLSTFVFVCAALTRVVLDWRRGLLALARAALYFLVLGFTPSPLGSVAQSNASDLTNAAANLLAVPMSSFYMPSTSKSAAKLIAAGGG